MKDKRKLQILLADDDEDDRMIFTEIVTQINEAVHLRTVSDGRGLLDLLSGEQGNLPDVIFLDLNMPNINGKECLRELKSDPVLRRLPVVIYSTSAAEKDINDTYRLGACLYIQKPSNIKGLRKTLEHVFTIDWTIGQPIVDKDNYLIKLSWLEAMLTSRAGLWQRCVTELPVHGPAFSIGWPRFQLRPQF